MMSEKEVKTKNVYTFNVTATMQVTNFLKRNRETMQLIQSYSKNALMSELKSSKNIIINDLESEAAIMIDPAKKTARVMSLSFIRKMTKTDKTKTLNGYTCYQYIITDEDTKVDAWFASGVNFDYNDYLSGMNKMFRNKNSNATSLLNKGQGYVMEMIMFQKSKKQSEMKVNNLSKITTTINSG